MTKQAALEQDYKDLKSNLPDFMWPELDRLYDAATALTHDTPVPDDVAEAVPICYECSKTIEHFYDAHPISGVCKCGEKLLTDRKTLIRAALSSKVEVVSVEEFRDYMMQCCTDSYEEDAEALMRRFPQGIRII